MVIPRQAEMFSTGPTGLGNLIARLLLKSTHYAGQEIRNMAIFLVLAPAAPSSIQLVNYHLQARRMRAVDAAIQFVER